MGWEKKLKWNKNVFKMAFTFKVSTHSYILIRLVIKQTKVLDVKQNYKNNMNKLVRFYFSSGLK